MVAALVTATARPAVAGPPATVGRPQAARPRVPARPAFAAAQQQRRRRLAAPPRAAADEEDEFEDEEEDEEESDEEENAEMAPADEAWLQGALADARSPEPECVRCLPGCHRPVRCLVLPRSSSKAYTTTQGCTAV